MHSCFDPRFHVVLKFFPMIRPSFWCEDRTVPWLKRVKTFWIKAPRHPPSDLFSCFISFPSDVILSRKPSCSELNLHERLPPATHSVSPLTGGFEPKDEQLKTLIQLLTHDVRTNSTSHGLNVKGVGTCKDPHDPSGVVAVVAPDSLSSACHRFVGPHGAHILTSNHAKHKHAFAELSGPFHFSP